ncbi:bifunctional diguanylate cyclase/phosphodiesterase [Noviherbaspirillum galbum]|uniref:Diguanylate cyclase n=1 Tax=Noviherbaspirillum galbum TaxID=2709383 RepID=A0A6B3SFQ5_9BURK|nr:diguanylate cyclase [Noviherbaspirillum galbum]NEX59488.1 diguanylate cyclase [Noviherbaspirillum galbum]
MASMRLLRVRLARLFLRTADPRLLFPGIGLLLLAAVWTIAFSMLHMARDSAEQAAIGSSGELIETYEAQMARNVGAINQALDIINYGLQLRQGGRGRSGQGRDVLAELAERALLPPALFFQARIVDRDGVLREATHAGTWPDIPAQAFFHRHRDQAGTDTFVSPPSQVGGKWQMHFSKRLATAQGAFAGVAIISVEPSYFTSGYDPARLGDRGVLGLLNGEGVFLVSRTGQMVGWGQRSGIVADESAGDREAPPSLLALNRWDGVRRYTLARQLHGVPLAVVIGLAEDEQLAKYAAARHDILWKATLASLLLITVVAAIGRLSWQLGNSRRHVRKAQETYYAASNASHDAFFILRTVTGKDGTIQDFVLDDTNRRGAALFRRDKSAMIGLTLRGLFPETPISGLFDDFVSVAQHRTVDEKEWMNTSPLVKAEWLQRQLVWVEGGVVAIVRDITQRKRAEAFLLEQSQALEMIATGMPVADVLHKLMQMVAARLPDAAGVIRLMDDDGKRMAGAASHGMPPGWDDASDDRGDEASGGPCGEAVRRGEEVVVADLAAEGPRPEGFSTALAHGLRACCSLPIFAGKDRVAGSVTMYFREARAPTRHERDVVRAATRLAGIAIERKQAERHIWHMAHHDPLTGLPNRSLLDDRLRQAILRAQRTRSGAIVAFIDLDNFKLVNDSLGHDAGDDLLKTAASRMVAAVRASDTVIRLGGDEFVIILHEQGEDADLSPLQEIHAAVARPMMLAGREVQVTCSMGAACYPKDGADPQTLLMNADAAMYRAKELGRNNVQAYGAEMHRQMRERLALQLGPALQAPHPHFTSSVPFIVG